MNAAAVLTTCNKLLQQAGLRVQLRELHEAELYIYYGETVRGARVIVLTRRVNQAGQLRESIISILQIVDKWTRHTWQINGQAGRNTRQVIYLGESRAVPIGEAQS
jgi:hypothetical protein